MDGAGSGPGARRCLISAPFRPETCSPLRLTSPDNQPVRSIVGLYALRTERQLGTRAFVDVKSQLDQIDNPALVIINQAGKDRNTATALLFLRGTTLMRQPFETAGLRLTGDPAPVAEDIGLFLGNVAAFSVSHTGVLVYSTGQVAMNRRLVWVDRRGAVTPLTLAPGDYDSPALSPDGQQIALVVRIPAKLNADSGEAERGFWASRTLIGA